MPPWAAFECERTGWTLARIPTDTPSSAAASAARCPARPAPITSTSWEGILSQVLLAGCPAAAIVCDQQRDGRLGRFSASPARPPAAAPSREHSYWGYAARGSGELRDRLER